MKHSRAEWYARALAPILPYPLLSVVAAGSVDDTGAGGPHFDTAADQTALFLLGLLVSIYCAFVASGWLLWKRARQPKAPHHELIARVEETNAAEELPSQSGLN